MGWDLEGRCFLLAGFEMLVMLYVHVEGLYMLHHVTHDLRSSQRGVIITCSRAGTENR